MPSKGRSFLLLLVLCCLPLTARARVFDPEMTTLKNGMQVVVIANHRAPVVTQMLWFRTGAINDPWGKSGIAHFLEHLMFKGTKNHPEGDYSKIISHMGGEENAFTSYDYTAYYATFGKEHLEEVMALESDRLVNWQVNDKQMAVERDVILKERQQRTENDPVSAFFEEVNALLFVNHPYQRPTIGWRSEMEKLNTQDAEAFHKLYYAPNNMILVLSGDVTLAEIKPLLEKYYAIIPARETPARFNPAVPEMKAPRRIQEESPLVRERLWSKHFIFAPARPATIAQSDALMVLVKILGDSRTGRLYRRLVVQDKIATQAYVSFDPVAYGPARLVIGVTPVPGVDLAKIEQAVDEELKKIAESDVAADELRNATQSLEIEAIYARDSVMGPAMTMGEGLVSGLDIKTIEAWPERMQSVTAKAVREQAQALQQKNGSAVIAILLPQAQKAPAKK